MGDSLPELQSQLELKLGRTLLMIQRCERLMKEMIVASEGSTDRIEAETLKKAAKKTRKSSTGNVLTLFKQKVLTPTSFEVETEPEPVTELTYRFRIAVEIPEEKRRLDLKRLQNFVAVRNWVVHRLIDSDPDTRDGCIAAIEELDKIADTIASVLTWLSGLEKSLDEVRHYMRGRLASQEFRRQLLTSDQSIEGFQ